MLYYCEMEIELRFSKSIKKFWHFDALNWTLTFSQFSLDLPRWSNVGSLINCTFELISNTHLHTVVSKYFNTLHCFYIYLFGFQSNSIDFHSNWLLVTTEHFNLQQKETMNENTPHFIIAVNYYWEVDSEKKKSKFIAAATISMSQIKWMVIFHLHLRFFLSSFCKLNIHLCGSQQKWIATIGKCKKCHYFFSHLAIRFYAYANTCVRVANLLKMYAISLSFFSRALIVSVSACVWY